MRSLVAGIASLFVSGAALGRLPAEPQSAIAVPADAPLSMQQAVHAAVAWHPAVRNATGLLRRADEDIAAARSGYYPQVRAGISSEARNRVITNYDTRRLHQASVSVSQMLYDFGKVSSAVGQAQAGVDVARAQVLLSADDVARETALAWVELRRQQALDVIAQAQVEGVKGLAALATERQVKGAATRSDAVQAQSRVDAALAQAVDISAQTTRWQLQLMHLTGRSAPPAVTDEAPQALGPACAIAAASGASAPVPPAVQRAQAQRAEAEAGVRVADAELLPTLSLDGAVTRGLDRQSRVVGQGGTDTSITFNLSAPLYEGGRSQARQRAAVHELQAAEAAVAHAELSVRQAMQAAQAQAQGHQQRAPVLAQRVESIRTTRDLYREQYLQLGTRSLLDLLNAEQEYHGARFEQVNGRHEQQRLAVECLYESGRLNEVFALDPVAAAAGGRP